MVNFTNLAISKIHDLKVYEHDLKNDLYIEIVYETQDGITRKVVYSDAGLNIQDVETREMFTALICIIYFIFDELDRREEFYSMMYRSGFEVFRRGFYYLALKSINRGYIINISIGNELKHMLKLNDSRITKNEYSSASLKYWEPTVNAYINLPHNAMKFHVGYTFKHELLWDPQFSLLRTYDLDMSNFEIKSKEQRFAINSEKVGLFIPLSKPTTAQLSGIETLMTNYPAVDFNIVFECEPSEFNGSQSALTIKVKELSDQFSNFRMFCKISGIRPNDQYKTLEGLIESLEPWEELFAYEDLQPSAEGRDEIVNHISGYVIDNIVEYTVIEGAVDTNESKDVKNRYGAFRKYLQNKNQFIILKQRKVPLQWFGSTDIPFDFFWQYWGDKLDIRSEDDYGLSYVDKRKAITIINEISPSLDEVYFERLIGYAKLLYVSNQATFESVSGYLDAICKYVMKYNYLLLNKTRYVDNKPLTTNEKADQLLHIENLGFEIKSVETSTGVYHNMLVKKAG